MNAVVASGKSSASDAADSQSIFDRFPYIVGGGILGAAVAIFAAMACGLVLAFANNFSGGEICRDGFSATVVAMLAFVAGLITISAGAWLFNLRKWIGMNAAPEDVANSRVLRSRFAVASMSVYCLLAPGVWLVAAASANCAAS